MLVCAVNDCPAFDGYTFFYGRDFGGYDIGSQVGLHDVVLSIKSGVHVCVVAAASNSRIVDDHAPSCMTRATCRIPLSVSGTAACVTAHGAMCGHGARQAYQSVVVLPRCIVHCAVLPPAQMTGTNLNVFVSSCNSNADCK